MSMDVDPETLGQVANTLRNSSADLESAAVTPPQPQDGELTEFFSATLSLLCERMGDLSVAVGGLGDSVAASRDDYLATDESQAANLGKSGE